jgi:hypothetical protein
MKKIFFYLLFNAMVFSLTAQTFNSPESVEYDTLNKRWIAGQNGSGEIHIYKPGTATLKQLVAAGSLPSGPHGIEILGNTVYACDGSFIKGFNLSTGAQVFNVNLSATFLNGLTTDGGHFLFATDFTTKKIYRINTLTNAYNLMATATYTPNGIIYDGAKNRCVFVNWGATARVQAISLADSAITTLYTTTTSNMDGITRDKQGNWYATAWGNNALLKFDPAFSTAPITVKTGLSSPADVDINAAGDSIGIPNSGSANNIVFYVIPNTTAVSQTPYLIPMQCLPNPAADQFKITLARSVENAVLLLFDETGKIILKQLVNGNTFTAACHNQPDGFYYISLYNNKGQMLATQKVALMR